MNKKLIAAAVSAAVVAPVASHADAVLYGRINNAIDINDLRGLDDDDNLQESNTGISSVASRIGVRANADVGNGLSVHGHYEFSTVTDKEGDGIGDTRVATVGVSGGFGRFDVGNQWSAYFNTFGTLVSPTYSLGYYLYATIGGGPFRASNTIKYSNTFGPVTAQLDVRLNEDGVDTADNAEVLRGEGIGLGLSFAVTDNISIAAAFDSEEREDGVDEADTRPSVALTEDGTAGDGILATGVLDDTDDFGHDEDRLGIAVKATFGGFWAVLGWQNIEYSDFEELALTGMTDANDDGTAAAPVGTVSGVRELDDNGEETVTAYHEDINTLFLWGGGNFSEQTSWMVGFSQADDGVEVIDTATGVIDETDDSTQATLGIYHNVGGGLRLYYEGISVDSENDNWDGARHLLGMRVDF